MARKIYFDMDGTIADLYGVDGWLDSIISEDPTPYRTAAVMCNMSKLARKLNKLQRAGWTLGIISWLPKNGTPSYNNKVAHAKLAWLKKHLSSVKFNEIHIVEYGTPKQTIGDGILFDDEINNRMAWGKDAHHPTEIMDVLTRL